MMLCTRNFISKNFTFTPISYISKLKYSRRSDRNTNTYKIISTNEDNLDDIGQTVFGIDPNWELFTPRGFRFYLPGSVGPGWLDASTTAQVEVRSVVVPIGEDTISNSSIKKRIHNRLEENQNQVTSKNSILHCSTQECPTLLRKGIMELFPNCLEVTSPQLTIITIMQKTNHKISRWSKEDEMEKLAQHFVLAASDICRKLKDLGYWADFINPFSGQPYLNVHKSGSLYKTDERFRCLGFKIQHVENCKVIYHECESKSFIGNLYTTAPSNTEFLKDVMNDIN